MTTADRMQATEVSTPRRVHRSSGHEETERHRFLTGLAHDLLNAVTVIGGTAQLAERRIVAAPDRLESISIALGATRGFARARCGNILVRVETTATRGAPSALPVLIGPWSGRQSL